MRKKLSLIPFLSLLVSFSLADAGITPYQSEIVTDPPIYNYITEVDPVYSSYYAKPAAIPPYSYVDSLSGEPEYNKQFQYNHINRGNVWDNYRGENVVVAIIDSGIDIDHEDFSYPGNISHKSAFITQAGDLVYTRTVQNYGLNIIDDNNPAHNGHGTAVAGTIGALVNKKGTAGIAPNVTLMILKTDYGYNEINIAIDYAVANGADIINMSIAAYDTSEVDSAFAFANKNKTNPDTNTFFDPSLINADNAGVLLVAAAGNETTDYPSYPASSITNVIGVGALGRDTSVSMADYSNFGTYNVDVVAPGSVWVPHVGGGYDVTNGTSFASPMVAGALALYLSRNPDDSAATVRNHLFSTATDMGTAGRDATYGYGRLNLNNLMDYVPATSFTISPRNLSLSIGQTQQLVTTILPSNATDQETIYLSQHEDIATVDDYGMVTAVGVGVTRIEAMCADGLEDYCIVSVDTGFYPVQSISFTDDSLLLDIGQTKQLNVVFNPDNATNKGLVYSSSSSHVASVSDTGLVRAMADGTTIITARSVDGNRTATIPVTVNYFVPASVTHTFTSASWGTVNNTFTSDKSANWVSASGVQVTSGLSGAGATSKEKYTNISSIVVRYCTNDSNGVGSINISLLDQLNGGVVSALPSFNVTKPSANGGTPRNTDPFIPSSVKDGYIKLSVNCSTNSVYVQSITINYLIVGSRPISVSGVNILNASPLNMNVDDTVQLEYQVFPLNASNRGVSFNSTNPQVASVNNSGLVRAIQAGNAIITVTTNENGHTASVSINVSESSSPNVSGVQFLSESLGLEAGTTHQLRYEVLPNSALDKAVSFTSSHENVATVNSTGLVNTLEKGSTTITIITNEGNYTDTIKVEVFGDTQIIETGTGNLLITCSSVVLHNPIHLSQTMALDMTSTFRFDPDNPSMFSLKLVDQPPQNGYEFEAWYLDRTGNGTSVPYAYDTLVTNDTLIERLSILSADESLHVYAKYVYTGIVIPPDDPPVEPPPPESNHYPYEGTYYNSVNFANFDATEKADLINLLDDQPGRSYNSRDWISMQDSCEDLNNPNNVILFYDSVSKSKDHAGGGQNGTIWNKEHVWPQSLMGDSGSSTIAGDLHNLFACDSEINNSRANYPYYDGHGEHGFVTGADRQTYYYPGDEWRGEVARALMYMSLRYGEGRSSYDMRLSVMVDIDTCLAWHEADPVSEWEMRHNDVLFNKGYQNNRNPFIDHPELAHLITWQ